MTKWHGSAHSHLHMHRAHDPEIQISTDLIEDVAIPTLVERQPYYTGDASASTSTCDGDSCGGTTPSSGDSTTIPIVLSVVIPLGCALIALFFLHRRHVRKQRFEDLNDKHKSLDFGLGDVRARNGKKGPDTSMSEVTAQQLVRPGARGLSMDMGSPYVLPGDLPNSRPSLSSYSRSLHDGEDPYRPVTMLRSGSTSPLPALPSKDLSPLMTDDSSSKAHLLQFAQTPATSSPSAMESPYSLTPKTTNASIPPTMPQNTATDFPNRKDSATTRSRSDSSPTATISDAITPSTAPSSVSVNDARHTSYTSQFPPTSRRSSSKAPRMDSLNTKAHETTMSGASDDWTTYADVLGIVQSEPTPQSGPHDASTGLLPTIHEPVAHSAAQQLAPPVNTARPLSASIRPLPPDDPADNAEQRANRIRSFYKEYFDDSKKDDKEYGNADYYEDYSQEYLNDATIYDPETGQFVVAGAPYAEPVTRRAMTPPPRAPPRFRGAPHGRSSAGSAGHPGPNGRFRAQSSASARPDQRGRLPKRNLPPPAALKTLPTPYLLKDDSALFSGLDFAPPSTYRDRTAGRAESPLGESRPYSPSVRAHTPLASSFNELPAMPSPHALRKSSTFTALDFAPSPRFAHNGFGSDAGSIRSGRSNMSRIQVANIRNGAYRVSRLEPTMVGTRDDLTATLKPNWELKY